MSAIMWSFIIVHIFKSIFVFIEVQLVSYAICVNVLMIVEVILLSLYNSFASQTEKDHDSLHLSTLNYLNFTIEGISTVYKLFY